MTKIAALLGFALALAVVGSASGYTAGVPVGLTGAPGEGTCANCHGNLNTGSGGCEVSSPYSYEPGETLHIHVDVHHMMQQKWGFELTCLDGLDEPCGEFVITDPTRTQMDVDDGNGRHYVMHTQTGTDEGHMNMCLGWDVDWIAPSEGTPQATFYVAAVAANDGSGSNGDYVYTQALAIEQTPVDSSTWARIKHLYR